MTADAFPWVDEGNEKRCTRHDRKFARTGVCPVCAKGMRTALPKIAKEPLPKPPKGCMSTTDIERWFTDLALASAARAVAIAAYTTKPSPRDGVATGKDKSSGTVIFDATAKGKGKNKPKGKAKPAAPEVPDFDFHLEASIANHRDRAIKAMRAACDLATRREDDEIVDRRDERMAGRERGAAH